jgi:hypothetical protein
MLKRTYPVSWSRSAHVSDTRSSENNHVALLGIITILTTVLVFIYSRFQDCSNPISLESYYKGQHHTTMEQGLYTKGRGQSLDPSTPLIDLQRCVMPTIQSMMSQACSRPPQNNIGPACQISTLFTPKFSVPPWKMLIRRHDSKSACKGDLFRKV